MAEGRDDHGRAALHGRQDLHRRRRRRLRHRAFLQQIDAKTGKLGWRFYTIPGPNDPGGDTWPQGSKAYLRGGASVWSTPAVDPQLGLMYFSTGNAGNDWFGGERAGKNLYASSIVALDIKTGKIKWSFQEVHHDIWDYDTPSPVVLFDAKTAAGKDIKGIGDPGKTGWLYLLDRTNGKPLYGIEEKPVPQNKAQKSWPTQPIPATSAFIPHGAPPAKDIARVKKERTAALKKVPVVIAKNIFTPPPPGKMLIYGPGPSGGNNWEPSSYNQKTHMFYVCALNTYVGVQAANIPFKVGQDLRRHRRDLGRRLQRGHRHVDRDRRDERKGRLAEEVAGTLLLGHLDNGRQPRLRRAQLRSSIRRTTPPPASSPGRSRPTPARTTSARSSRTTGSRRSPALGRELAGGDAAR